MRKLSPSTTKVRRSMNYGEFRIVEYTNNASVRVKFIDTGHEASVTMQNVNSGNIRDPLMPNVLGVGYIGIGKHRGSINGEETKAVKIWRGMLERCYGAQEGKNRTYKGCTVCEEWHNFQNFADWFYDNYIEGYHLDKDIKVDGNKVYSPGACLFVSPKDNNTKAQAKTYKLIDPRGNVVEVYNMAELCREYRLSHGNMSMVISGGRKSHKGWRAYNDPDLT